ncbi:MAG TPA: TonB-dependent receptor plug domain-containing protein [Opitutaceae bacterium]|nr:TonB-dependent receptor plug domain-containing protein [Opitutaceae bacterium]
MTTYLPPLFRGIGPLLPLMAATTLSFGQVTPKQITDQDETVRLNVFNVSAENDDEYRAANTTTGTRYSTPVKDLPMTIEVLTTSFMRDIGAYDVREALEYVAGVQLDTSAGGVGGSRDNPENSTLLVRGISAATLKDGFRRFVPIDSITISRADIIKGPGGALYGQGATGGVVQVSSVIAGNKPVARFSQSFGSYDLYRTEFLWSGPIDKKKLLGFALPVAYQTNKTSAMYYRTDTLVFNPAVTFKLTPNTTILASIDYRFNERDNVRGNFITDNTRAPDGSFYGTFIDGRPGNNRVLTTPDQRNFRFEGPDTFRKERDYVRTIRIDHRFNDNLQWWGGLSTEVLKVRERSFNVSPRNANDTSIPLKIRNDPRFLALLRPTFNNGQPQVLDIRPNNIVRSATTIRPTYKTELYSAFETGPVKHRMIVGASYGPLESANDAPNTNIFYGNTNTPNDPVTQLWEALPAEVILTRFRDLRDYTSVQRWNNAAYSQFPQAPESAYGGVSAYQTSLFWDRNLYINLQSSFFNDKIQTIAGFFDTRNDRAANVYDRNGNYLWGGPAPAGSPSGTINGIRRPEPVKNTAPSFTLIWLPNDTFRIYGNVMSALDPGPAYSAYDGNGIPLTAPVVSNMEAGVRLDLFRSKLLLNVVAFKMKDEDRPVSFGAAIQNLLTNPGGTANNSGFSAFVNTNSESEGFDLKIDYLPMRNLRFNLGAAMNDVQITEIAPFVTPANPDPVRLAAQERFVASGGSSSRYLGKPSTDISKYTGSGFVRYEIDRGALKNVWFMAAAKYLGRREAELITVSTSTGDITVDRRDVPDHFVYDFNMGYRKKFGRYTTDFRLNVANVADDDKFYGATWQVGRTYRLSAGVNF